MAAVLEQVQQAPEGRRQSLTGGRTAAPGIRLPSGKRGGDGETATERRAPQRAVAATKVVAVATGLPDAVFGIDGLSGAGARISLHIPYRYLFGPLAGIGLLVWTWVPGIEDQAPPFPSLTLVVALGDLGLLLGLHLAGILSVTMLAALAEERAVAPFPRLQQTRIAARAVRHG